MKNQKFDGYLICPGNSKKQINQFKRMFACDNLKFISKDDYYLQMRKVSHSQEIYSLDVNLKKENIGYFSVRVIEPTLLSMEIYKVAEFTIEVQHPMN